MLDMAKTAAERQKEYRERKKQKEGAAYLQKESNRVKNYYKRTEDLNKNDKVKRRRKVREQVREHRRVIKLKELRETQAVPVPVPGRSTESGDGDNTVSSTTDWPTPMTVQLPCMTSSRKKSRKRISHAVSKSNRDLSRLKHENLTLKRSVKRVSKRYERLFRKHNQQATSETSQPSTATDTATEDSDTMTPNRKTEQELQNLKIATPGSRKTVKRRLLLANCLEHELFEAKAQNRKKHLRSLVNIVSGRVVKKYRAIRYISNKTGINRRTLCKSSSKHVTDLPKMKWKTRLVLQQDVLAFYERDDNSRCMPGKNDTVKDGKSKLQRRVLNDYLANLFLKFKAEFPEMKLSLSTFCKLRPTNVLPVSFTARNTCLCSKHQNMALKLRSLKSINAVSSSSPDSFIKAYTQTDIEMQLSQTQLDKISYKTWKKVTDNKGKSKMKLVDEEMAKADFISSFLNQCSQFREHVVRVQTQYSQLKFLKDNLSDSHAIIQMDFAENYLCQCLDEIQSAYWNATMVTLHPVVVYYKNKGVLSHKSFIFVSDTLTHSFPTVYTILQSLLPEVKELVPSLSYVHYWTDSPSSQYRNKTAFNYVLQHPQEFDGVRASWNYFESGHGKGPCDGLGGTAKRMADSAVKQGKFNIQSAHDFFFWATGHPSSVCYIFISKEDCDANQKRLEQWGVKPVKGTMTIHAVFETEGSLMVKETSCFCNGCFASGGFLSAPSCLWQRRVLVTNPARNEAEGTLDQTDDVQAAEEVLSEANVVPIISSQIPPTVQAIQDQTLFQDNTDPTQVQGNTDPTQVQGNPEGMEISINDFVAAVYEFDNKVYFGKVLDVDETDYQICFMEASGKSHSYKWPRTSASETIWVNKRFVLDKVSDPKSTGKSNRMFVFLPEDHNKINNFYKKYLKN